MTRTLKSRRLGLPPGTKVRLSALALRRMGSLLGPDRFMVVELCWLVELDGAPCRLCASGRHVLVQGGRHIALAALNLPAPPRPLPEGASPDTDNRGLNGWTLETADPLNLAQAPSQPKRRPWSPQQVEDHVERMRREHPKVDLG